MRRKSKSKFQLPSKYMLMILTLICGIMIYVSFTMNLSGGPLNTAAGYVLSQCKRVSIILGFGFQTKRIT